MRRNGGTTRSGPARGAYDSTARTAELLGQARDLGALRDQMIVLADKGLAGRWNAPAPTSSTSSSRARLAAAIWHNWKINAFVKRSMISKIGTTEPIRNHSSWASPWWHW